MFAWKEPLGEAEAEAEGVRITTSRSRSRFRLERVSEQVCAFYANVGISSGSVELRSDHNVNLNLETLFMHFIRHLHYFMSPHTTFYSHKTNKTDTKIWKFQNKWYWC